MQAVISKEFGAGTQKVEEELHSLFPDLSVIRMDVDTTSVKSSHRAILEKFDKEKIDILLGTQMVAKGLDFPNVTLVGVLAADQSLFVDDFRAGERTFDLITQVCGRPAEAKDKAARWFRPCHAENSVICQAQEQDYLSFYENEIELRRQLNYPPFCDIISILLTSPVLNGFLSYAKKLARSIHIVMQRTMTERLNC